MTLRRSPGTIPLTTEDADRALRMVAVAADAVEQARELLAHNTLVGDCLDEVGRLLELTQVHANAEAQAAEEARAAAVTPILGPPTNTSERAL
ncbi:MAG: hypothetical protein ACRDRO_03980 [Pseudonocardiaceae bacterium]